MILKIVIFLLKVIEKYGFSQDVLKWIVILLQNQESCVVNGGKITRYFPLKRGRQQGHPILAYLFIPFFFNHRNSFHFYLKKGK